jgi:fucose permease
VTSPAAAAASAPAAHNPPTAPPRGVLPIAYASFVLIGWTGLLVPSYLLVIQGEFGRTDAEFGLVYLVFALMFAVGAVSAGLIAERIGRQVVLPAAALLIAVGLATVSVAPTWTVFVVGAGLAGASTGAVDAVVNSVVMDLSVSGRGSGLSRLHLFYSVGALAAPLVVGVLSEAGIGWRPVAAASAIAGLAIALPLRRVGLVPRRRRAPADPAVADQARAGLGRPLKLALAALAVGIACYVAAEAGVTGWLVGYLAEEPMSLATLALSLFWTGLAAGRLTASRIADRFEPTAFTATFAFAAAVFLLAAIAGPAGPLRIALFMAAGFAFGPVYPMIMTVAGSILPHRAAAISGALTAAGVAGSVTYPALMGVISEVASLGAAMVGAALLAAVSGVAVLIARRIVTRR